MKINFVRRLRENKIVVIIICVIIICIVYFCSQEAIDNFVFNSNSDILIEEEMNISSMENGEDADSVTSEILKEDNSGMIGEEEVDLEVFGIEETGDITDDRTDESSAELGNKLVKESRNSLEVSKIYVYITGEVNSPGVVVLNEGSRIVDAINAAGGTTTKANVTKVNLVYILDDGMKVNIPNNDDLKNNPDFEYITRNSGDGSNEDYLTSTGGGNSARGNSSAESSKSGYSYSIVNINTATQTELESLPGIGPSLALKIINYRKENGKFSSIEDIKNVSGIGESKFESLKEYITV